MRKLTLVSLFIFLLIPGCKNGDASSIADEVLTHFGNSCSGSYGQWTRAALGQTRSLVKTLEALKDSNDEACKGLGQALGSVQDVQYQLQAIADDEVMLEYKLAQEKRVELIEALNRLKSSGGSPVIIAEIQTRLYALEMEISEAKAKVSVAAEQDDRKRLINGIAQLTDYLNTLSADGNIAACMAAGPYLPFQLATSIMAIGGNFLSAGTGSAISGLGQLMSASLNFIRKFPIDKAKLDLENIKMQSAMACTLESMSQLWCDAQDSFEFVNFAIEHYDENKMPEGIWRGLDLLGKRLPVLNEWLVKVSSGLDPQDPSAAERMNKVWERTHQMRLYSNRASGFISAAKRLLDGVSDPAVRLRVQRATISDLIGAMYRVEDSPFRGYISSLSGVCRLSGDPNCEAIVKASPGIGFSQLLEQVQVIDGIVGLRKRNDQLVAELNLLINKELRNTINQDPDRLVTEATQPSLQNLAPVEVMELTVKFLNDYVAYLKKKGLNRRTQRIIRDAEATVVTIDVLLKSINDLKVPSAEIISKVFKELKLLNSISFLNDRVINFVRWELEDKVRNGDLPKDISEDLIVSGRNIVDQLEASRIYLEEDADEVLGDITDSQSISQQNLDRTIDFYGKTISKVLKNIKKAARDAGETEYHEPNLRKLAHTCLLVLTTSIQWPKDVDMDICKGTKIKSVYKKSKLELNFDTLKKKITKEKTAFKDRVCIYSNFLKASRLFTRTKPPGSLLNTSELDGLWDLQPELTQEDAAKLIY